MVGQTSTCCSHSTCPFCAGVVLNGWLPGWVTSFTLTLFLVYVAWGSAGKAGKLVQKERQEKGQHGRGDGAEDGTGQNDRLLPEQDQQQQGNDPVPQHPSGYNKVLNWCRCAGRGCGCLCTSMISRDLGGQMLRACLEARCPGEWLWELQADHVRLLCGGLVLKLTPP